MRTLVTVLSLTALAAATLAGTATAKEGGVEVASLPLGLEAGEPWSTTLRLVEGAPAELAAARPGITIEHGETGRALTFAARPTADPRRYEVRVVFPDGGLWTVEAYDGVTGRSYSVGGGRFFVDEPSAAPAATRSASEDGGWPIWPAALGGGLGLVLPAAGAALLVRRRR
ncbi:MAG TPA: hypothetical protein VHF23_01475 [Gaiellaceae bacterium]|nr:hypothetical protein [Gaiellaceae bacterium]